MTAPDIPALPVVSEFARNWWESLPEVHRIADPSPGGSIDYPLLRFLSLGGDQAQEVVDLITRVDYFAPYEGGTDIGSDLVDPDRADLSWLPWLGQIVGVDLTGLEPESVQRSRTKNASNGWMAGSHSAMTAAAAETLTGTKFVQIMPGSDAYGNASRWDILIRTRREETPDPQAVLDAILGGDAAPAGVQLWHAWYAASWDTLEAAYPTSDAWDATGSWDAIEGTGGGASGANTGGEHTGVAFDGAAGGFDGDPDHGGY